MGRNDVLDEMAELVLLCEEIGDGYRAAAGTIQDDELSSLFAWIAAKHYEMAGALKHHLPHPPTRLSRGDTELTSFIRALSRLKVVLPRRAVALIADRERADLALANRLAQGYDRLGSEDIRVTLRHLVGDLTASLGLLAAARVRRTH